MGEFCKFHYEVELTCSFISHVSDWTVSPILKTSGSVPCAQSGERSIRKPASLSSLPARAGNKYRVTCSLHILVMFTLLCLMYSMLTHSLIPGHAQTFPGFPLARSSRTFSINGTICFLLVSHHHTRLVALTARAAAIDCASFPGRLRPTVSRRDSEQSEKAA